MGVHQQVNGETKGSENTQFHIIIYNKECMSCIAEPWNSCFKGNNSDERRKCYKLPYILIILNNQFCKDRSGTEVPRAKEKGDQSITISTLGVLSFK